MEVEPGDGLLAQGAHGADAEVDGLAVSLHRPLVVEGLEAVRTLKQLLLGPAEVVGLDVDGAGVLVFELALAHGAGHCHVRGAVRVVRLQIHGLELLQLRVRLGPVSLQRAAVVKYLVTPAHATG